MWKQGWREVAWADLDRPWDVIVVGGGITGAGILREAARAGMQVLLLEGQDFASGTSSRSSKLVHGGLRYLRNGQLQTTVASVHERERLLKDGKGLVTPLGFLFVSFAGDKLPLRLFGLGLTVYDILGLRWGHKRYDVDDLLRLAPDLNKGTLIGGYRYFDAQTDDARLVLRLIREAVMDGGAALNYVRVESLLQERDGKVAGVAIRDMSENGGGRTVEVLAKVVINATGADADTLRIQLGSRARLRCLRGSHLVFSAARFPLGRAVSFAHPVDQRPVFALPWEGVTLFGTTDVDHRPVTGEPAVNMAEVDYLLTSLDHAFPAVKLSDGDVMATFSGIRAVVDTGKVNPSKESREHVLWRENGLLTITGGKLTTFRVMAHDVLRAIRKALPGKPPVGDQPVLKLAVPLERCDELAPIQRARLLGRYGEDAQQLIDAAGPSELGAIGGSVALWAEMRWAARSEGVIHLDDLLLRRVRLGLLLPEGGLPWIERIREIAQPELGWDDSRWLEEVGRYTSVWRQAYGPQGSGQLPAGSND